MKAIILTQHGGIDSLEYHQNFPEPKLDRGWVIVKVAVTALNRVDLVVRNGYPGIEIPLPHILGGDIAGTIAEVGPDVSGWKVGERIMAYPLVSCGECALCLDGHPNLCLQWKYLGLHLRGGYGEFATVPAANLIRLPDSISFNDAVALPVAGLTAYHGLKTVGALKKGQSFFIWGGTGGVGTLAVQIAKQLGAKVIATGNGGEKLDLMRDLGVDLVLDRSSEDIAARVREFAPAGVDLLMDYVGPATFPTSFDLLKKGGTVLLCGILTGRECNVSLHQTYLRHLSIKGLYLGTKGELEELLGWVAEGRVKPHIGAELPLSEARQAQRLMESGAFAGKIVLKVGE